MKRMRLIVSGRVQGVGYRASVRRRITPLGVTGFIRNLPDGTVEIVCEGDSHTLKEIIEIAKEGSLWSSTKAIDKTYAEPTGEFLSFDQLRTPPA